jgi:tRNA (guanine-N7-)-methyltransferase
MTRPGRSRLRTHLDPGPLFLPGEKWVNGVDLVDWFANTNSVELEIGSGLGLFLIEESQRRPNVNFLGVEVAEKIAQVAARRCLLAGIRNVRVVAADARRLTPKLPAARFSAVHIYFPDPWWKRRHRKRRIVAPDVLQEVERLLTPGGALCLATDVAEYFAEMQRTLARFPAFTLVERGEPTPEAPPLTNFEKKFRLVGKPVWRARYSFAGRALDVGHNGAEVGPT